MAVTVTAAAKTDIGKVRRKNQDTFGLDAALKVYVVCDGMGGVAGGEIASCLSVDAFLATLRTSTGNGQKSVAQDEPQRSDLLLFQAVKAANASVLTRANSDPALRGMGSTLVAALVEDHRLHLANVGDSRAYLVRGREIRQLTVDHSYLQEQVRQGFITEEMAAASPMQSVITRAVGVEENLKPDLSGLLLEQDDRILLTSDGLTRHVSDSEIADIISAPESPSQTALERCCERLIELANERGGSDNITCLLFRVEV